MHAVEIQRGQGRQRARAQPLRQPLHTVGAGCTGWAFEEAQHLERRQHRSQLAQQRQVGRREVSGGPVDLPRLAQPLAAPHPQLEAQRCGRLIISPQLLQQHLRQPPHLAAGAAVAHGDARIEHVAQLAEDDALLVTAQLRQRHRGARARRQLVKPESSASPPFI
eukprot:scaffold92278_cov62-Phaeocystis_antarctica.AAC.10